jgi:hypothetical protein
MTNDPVINNITRRTERYWYQDGIWEIGFGLVNFVLAAFYWIVEKVNWEGPMSIVLLLLQIAIIVGIFLFMNRFVRLLKERITYPRAGYVAYRRPPTRSRIKRILMTALVSAGTALLVGAVAASQMMPNRMPLISGIIMAAALVYLGYRLQLVRLFVQALLTVILGFITALIPLTDMNSTTVYFGGFGLLMMLTGGAALLMFVRRTQLSSISDDYEVPGEQIDAQDIHHGQ